MPKIAISYRRADSQDITGRIFDRLVQRFGKKSIFRDIDSIRPGIDFRDQIEETLQKSDVLLAIVGPKWVGHARGGEARIDNEADPVRTEVATALRRKIPLVPILVGGTKMPTTRQLPDDIKAFAFRHAVIVDSGRDFDHHMDGLIRALDGLISSAEAATRRDESDEEDKEPRSALGRGVVYLTSWTWGRMAAVAAILAIAAAVITYRGEISTLINRGEISSLPNITPATPKRDSAWSVTPGSGEGFRDPMADGQPCPSCPELTVVPSGSFMMGSPDSEPEREAASESPQMKVAIARPFAVGKFAITRVEFEAFAKSTNYTATPACRSGSRSEVAPGKSWRDPGFAQDDRHPVVCIPWADVVQYLNWLSKITGRTYRLLSDAEREYVTRAGTTTPFWWGSSITPAQANYKGNEVYSGGGSKGDYRYRTVPVESFAPNSWGLYNVHGNVWEWLQDCWNESHDGNPGDGTAREVGDCSKRVERGGGWSNSPSKLRSARRISARLKGATDVRGFRVGRDMAP